MRPLASQAQASRTASGSRDVYFNVRSYGATGDGNAIDSPAIDAAASVGGGTVVFPAGTYASYSTPPAGSRSLASAAGIAATRVSAASAAEIVRRLKKRGL